MTDDFSQEARRALRSALEHLERQAPHAPPLPHATLREPARPWPRPAVVIAGFVVAGLVVLPGLWWLRSNETAGPATSTSTAAQPSTTTTTGASTPTTVASVTANGIAFRRVVDVLGAFESGTLVETAPSSTPGDTLGGSSGIEISAVVDSPEGLVAVGHEQIGLRSIAAAWFSEDDGQTWERVASDPEVFGGTDHPIGNAIPTGLAMRTVAYGQGKFVALGSDTTTDLTPVAWVSDDGRSWTRVAGGPEGEDGYATVSGVTFTGTGFVGIGNESHPSGDITATTVMVWTSPDGLDWSTRRDVIGAERPSIVTDLTLIGDTLVAVGYTIDPEAVAAWHSPAAWFSSDGITWTAAEVTDPMGDATRYTEMRSVATTGSGGVALGWTMTSESLLGSNTGLLVWTTSDGMVWTPVDVDHLADDIVRIPGPVASGPAGILAIISLEAERLADREPGMVAWTSDDGATWEQTPFGFLGQMRDITFTAAGYVAVGSAPGKQVGEDTFWDGAVWIGEIEEP